MEFKKDYADINDLYVEVLKEIEGNGELKGKRREKVFLTFTLNDLNKNVLFFPFSQRNWPWILRECSDRIAGIKNPGTSYKYSKNWENRIEDSGLYSYHYSDRLNGQLEKLLSTKIHSRDKILSVWHSSDYGSKGRQPCTIIMQPIMEHDDRLSIVVYMRNNDMINIFPSDVFIHSTYLKYWATKAGVKYGNLYWVSAVAYYQKKRDKLNFPKRLIEQWEHTYKTANIKTTEWNEDVIEDFIIKEGHERQLATDSEYATEDIDLNTDYMREWYDIMRLYHLKKIKDKTTFTRLINRPWSTEFSLIKDSFTVPK